jgi:hypothetical protein
MTAIWTKGSEADLIAFLQTWSGVACDVRYNPHAAPERQFEFHCAYDQDRAATPVENITRLVDAPAAAKGMHTYRCNACGATDEGHDRVAKHMKWRQWHWEHCWGMTRQPYWWP